MASDLASAAYALLRHYIAYLTNPAVIISTLIVVLPVLFGLSAERVLILSSQKPPVVPGCRRLGLKTRSNLQQDKADETAKDDGPTVKALFTYPIKSCRGVELAASEVESTGLRYDRLFTFAQHTPKADQKAGGGEKDTSVQDRWRFITQREFPKLALLQTQLWLPDPRGRKPTSNGRNGKALQAPTSQPRPRSRTRGNTLMGQLEQQNSQSGSTDWAAEGGCLLVRFQYEPAFNPFHLRTEMVTLTLPLAPSKSRAEANGYTTEELSIWKDNVQALNVTPEIDPADLRRLQAFLGVKRPLALFRMDDAHKRAITRSLPLDASKEDFKVGFADAFPTNLLGVESVKAVDEKLTSRSKPKQELDARRFRANIYVAGATAFAEDSWKFVTIGRRLCRDHKGLFEVDAEYHVACRTARCKLPNVDPDTGLKDRNEPYATLRKTRQVDEGANPHPCLGMQMIPVFERGIIRVGDKVTVLETGEHEYEKMFP